MARADEPEAAPKPRDLGPPLVDNLKGIKQLAKYAAWLDPKNKQVVLVGEACKADYPLEFFITTRARAYESVLVIDGERHPEGQMSVLQQVQLALILCGTSPDTPPTTGTTRLPWPPATKSRSRSAGRTKRARPNTRRPELDSRREDEEAAGENVGLCRQPFCRRWGRWKTLLADSGEFVCVLNNPIAMLDLPVVSTGAIEDRSFEANPEKLPPPGTPVTIVLIPQAAS